MFLEPGCRGPGQGGGVASHTLILGLPRGIVSDIGVPPRLTLDPPPDKKQQRRRTREVGKNVCF